MLLSFVLFELKIDQFYTRGFGYRSSGFTGSPNGIYVMSLFGAFIAIAALHCKISRYFFFPMLVVSGATLINTFSRSGWLGFAAGLYVFSLICRIPARWKIVVVVVLIVMCSVLVRFHVSDSPHSDGGLTEHRLRIWSIALQCIRHPWSGEGQLGFYDQYLSNLQLRHYTNYHYVVSEPKNLVLNILIKKGAPFLALFAAFLLILTRRARKYMTNRLDFDSAAVLSYLCVLTAVLVAGAVDSPLFADPGRIGVTALFFIHTGIVLKVTSGYKPTEHSKGTLGPDQEDV